MMRQSGTLHTLRAARRTRNTSLGLFPGLRWFSGGCNPNRIVIPRVESQGEHLENTEWNAGMDTEYARNKHIHAHTASFLSRDGAESLQRQRQLAEFGEATRRQIEEVWKDSKPHLRKQEKLIEELGVEGAVRETLNPSRTSFRADLRQRPLDRSILEEIYRGLHGRRIERKLKRGVSWEHWITKGDGTAPVYTTSRKSRQTFAFGGHVELLAAAAHPQQFPVVPLADTAAASEGGAGGRGRRPRAGKAALFPRERLLPEVAFIGRTNSGKSSLVNAIVNAMITPYGHLQGTTDAVRFYSVAGKLALVDCPGYGYFNPMGTPALDAANAVRAMRAYLRAGARRVGAAGGPRGARARADDPPAGLDLEDGGAVERGGLFGVPTEDADAAADDDGGEAGARRRNKGGMPPTTLCQPRNLKRVFVCVSSHGMQHMDLKYCQLLERLGIPFSVVLCKTDAAPIRFLARLADYTRCQLVHFNHCKELMLTSSLRLAGIDKMQDLIASMGITESKLSGVTMDFSMLV